MEEQQIILNVAKYFQEESKSGNKPQFRAGAVIAKTAAATGVNKNSVRKIVSAGKVIDEGKLVKQRYDLESWITLMLASSEESFGSRTKSPRTKPPRTKSPGQNPPGQNPP